MVSFEHEYIKNVSLQQDYKAHIIDVYMSYSLTSIFLFLQ